ncbi:N-acetylmuramoyl-L-alanine amidase family protein [Paenibacillus alvei]|uniref:N-acetylmuramoyl-L-alanine amidase family protein n=1 Tax=Paenibacillus alvei TaxID=44250 RepID=UPI001F50A374|nr:N-acetylmuramoyl-L-alanine amidase [Paenibacillus alvei]
MLQQPSSATRLRRMVAGITAIFIGCTAYLGNVQAEHAAAACGQASSHESVLHVIPEPYPISISSNSVPMESVPSLPFTKLVLIDAGHGGIDGGTSHGDILEKDINLAIAQKLYLMLKSKGIPVIVNRTGDYALSDDNRWSATRSRHRKDLAQRRQLSQELSVSMFISIHVNWSINKANRGPIVLHQNEGRSRMLAWFIQQSLNPIFRSNKHPELGPTYYLLKRVEQPAVIVEAGFISNDRDRRMLTETRTQTLIASRICDAIVHYQTMF